MKSVNKKNQEKPLVSILISCFNYGDLIEQAVNSVYSQTYPNIELVVINDGSSDNSGDVIKKITKKYKFNYIDQENIGVVGTIEKAVSISRGEYFIHLAADDILPDNYVEELVGVAKETGAAIVYTDLINLDTGEVVVRPPEFSVELLKHYNFIHGTSMVSMDLMARNKYDNGLRGLGMEDWDFFLTAVLEGEKAVYTNKTHLRYRRHEVLRSRSQRRRQNGRGLRPLAYVYSKNIKKFPEEMKHFSWISINMNEAIDYIDSIEKKNELLEEENNKTKKSLEEHKKAIHDLRSSESYKLGVAVTKPIRLAKRTYQSTRHRAGLYINQHKLQNKIEEIYKLTRTAGIPINVDIIIRSYHHPTSSTFIRLLSPLSHGSLGNKLNIKLVDGKNYNLRSNVDVVIVQRTAIPDMNTARRLVTEVREKNIKIFVDTDDAFGSLDKDHPQYREQVDRSESLRYIIEQADESWFSTKELSNLYKTKSSMVVYNTLDERIWRLIAEKTPKINQPKTGSPLKIVYMGTVTHSNDFEMIRPTLEKLGRDYEGQFELSIVGVARGLEDAPWLKVLSPDSALYPEFVEWLSRQGPFDIGISPLEDNEFNRAKSDIKCLDYMGMGVEPVVSNVEAYKNPKISKFITRVNNTDDDWYKVLSEKIENRDNNRQKASKRAIDAIKYIQNERSSHVPEKQIEKSILKYLAEDE